MTPLQSQKTLCPTLELQLPAELISQEGLDRVLPTGMQRYRYSRSHFSMNLFVALLCKGFCMQYCTQGAFQSVLEWQVQEWTLTHKTRKELLLDTQYYNDDVQLA